MGLDMYLNRRRQVFVPEPSLLNEALSGLGDTADYAEVTLINELAYWRKANQIHNWFVTHLMDGDTEQCECEVSLNHLAQLREACEQVLTDHRLAEQLLPTTSGFFFGSTEYDEHYFQDLRDTLEKLTPIISNMALDQITGHNDVSLVYQASW